MGAGAVYNRVISANDRVGPEVAEQTTTGERQCSVQPRRVLYRAGRLVGSTSDSQYKESPFSNGRPQPFGIRVNSLVGLRLEVSLTPCSRW